MTDTTTQASQQAATTENNQPQDNSAAIANAIWNETPIIQQPTTVQAPVVDNAATTAQAAAVVESTEEVLDINEWLKREVGVESADTFKTEWEALRKLKENPPKTEEQAWANEESKKFYEYLKGDKREDVRRVLNQQAELERLEKYEITDAAQAAEIIKANLRFKHQDLDPKQIDRLFSRQYSLPAKPQQGDQSDEEYARELTEWQTEVQEREQDIMIDAKIAKPELANYKSQIVLPDIPKATDSVGQPGPSQEDLAAAQAFRNDFVQKLGTDYRNFKGYNTVAKDGEVELPISYGLTDEEKLAFNPTIQKAVDNIQGFLDVDLGWWDAKANSFNINKMQEDLYLLLNRERIFSKMTGESAAQRFQHHLKITNNINLNGVNTETAIPSITGQPLDEKAKNQKLAEAAWAI